jgi:predicted signal transduction protein with EAL and GGDEF domain
MKKLTEYMTKLACIYCIGSIGDALLIVGIVTAAINATFAAFTPITWFLLVIAFYLGTIFLVLMSILVQEDKQAGYCFTTI